MSLLEHSKQRWKLLLFIVLMALGAGVTLFQGFLYEPLGKELALQLVVGAMVVIIFTFIWACLEITCPSCDHKLFWHAITKAGFGSWFVWLFTKEHCPNCGYPERPARKAAKGRGKR